MLSPDSCIQDATTNEGFNSTERQLFGIPIGPYGESNIVTGSPSWNSIQRLSFNFYFDAQKPSGSVWLDGLYIAGQVGFIQKDSSRISQYGLSEIPIVDNAVREETAYRDLGKA